MTTPSWCLLLVRQMGCRLLLGACADITGRSCKDARLSGGCVSRFFLISRAEQVVSSKQAGMCRHILRERSGLNLP